MLFDSSKPLTRSRASSCLIYNQLVAPGVGSIMGGRFISGVVQFALALGGCGLMMVWLMKYFYGVMNQSFNGPDNGVTLGAHRWMWTWGLIAVVVSWVWSGITSLMIMRQANQAATTPGDVPPLIASAAPDKSKGTSQT